MGKIILYQIFTRLYANRNISRVKNGTLAENGCGKMNDFSPAVLRRIRSLGVTHVWYTGIIRHATQSDYSAYGIPRNHPAIVKGRAGSPYAITDYYDVDPDIAVDVSRRMDEFEALLSRTHAAEMKVIIDFVPNHVARQYKSVCRPAGVKDLGEDDDLQCGFSPQNNFYYCPGSSFAPYIDLSGGYGGTAYTENPAKATGNDHFDSHPGPNDWYETVKLNYGVDYYAGGKGHFTPVPDTWRKLLAILMFWAAKGVDGFRCDMAEMVPAEFWHWAVNRVKERYPELLFIGEVYNPSEYNKYIASGFDYLYDKVGMYDTLRAVVCGYRPASAITEAWQSVGGILGRMLYFLENHDEQRVASDFFAGCGERGIPALVVAALMQTNPFMIYAGQEYGERGMDEEGFSGRDGRTTIFDYWSIDTLCRAWACELSAGERRLYGIYRDVLSIAGREKAVCSGFFFDLMYVNPSSEHFDSGRHYAFLRKADEDLLLVVANFGDSPADIRVTVPAHAFSYLGIPEKTSEATDLLTGDRQIFRLSADGSVPMTVDGWSARVWKMSVAADK